ncbi:hypothetical protein ACTXQV_29590, partial [Klebsiella pneumoniae]|uniref:hypothetical protein n=1 Tax=Klebsiella pneumoniae TaxID=573 RepID=UPI0039C17DB6
ETASHIFSPASFTKFNNPIFPYLHDGYMITSSSDPLIQCQGAGFATRPRVNSLKQHKPPSKYNQ